MSITKWFRANFTPWKVAVEKPKIFRMIDEITSNAYPYFEAETNGAINELIDLFVDQGWVVRVPQKKPDEPPPTKEI